MFASRKGKAPPAANVINRSARAAGIREKIGDITLIQKLLNHSAPSITLAYIGITRGPDGQCLFELKPINERMENYMPIISCPNGKEILLDQSDYEKAKDLTWLAYKYEGDHAKVFTLKNRKRFSMSSLIFGISGQQCIYHKNGNPFDFRRENIVICKNRSEFAQLAFPRVDKTSKYNNVYFNPKNSKWIVKIIYNRKIIHGGYFVEEYDAAIVADHLIHFYYGRSIKLNFPEWDENALKSRYNEVMQRYGTTVPEKYARCHQGISSNREKASPYVGVCYDSQRRHWIAQLTFCKKTYYKRGLNTDVDAALEYDKMALQFYGKNARFNFPT